MIRTLAKLKNFTSRETAVSKASKQTAAVSHHPPHQKIVDFERS
jgi:hypothetical protein